MRKLFQHGLALIVCILFALPSSAASIPKPVGNTILQITGKISNTNDGEAATFDRETLEQLGSDVVVTKTPWHDGLVTFSGVRLDKLLALVGARGQTVTAVGLDDYVTQIPIDDLSDFGVILALKRNGEYMSVREMGPLFIIYPYDSNPALQSQLYFNRSAWQVAKLLVE